MGGIATKALLSMLRSSKRMPGRSWKTELFRRTLRLLFDAAATRPAAWSRAQLDKVPVSSKLLSKVQSQTIKIAGSSCLEVIPQPVSKELLIVYLHGGGYVTGSPWGYRGLLAQVALACQARVVAPDYRLSPEHPFPTAQKDCLAVVKELLETADERSLVLMGDSAGGGLSVSTALALAGNTGPDALVLLSPWVEPTASSGTMLSNDANDIFTKEFLDRSFAAHMQDADRFDARVNFTNAELKSLPDTYIQSGAGELFHDQIADFVDRANGQAAQVEWDSFPAQFHVFQTMSPYLPEAKQAIAKIADFCESVSAAAPG